MSSIGLVTRAYGVWLSGRRVGTLHQRGDYTRFAFEPTYWALPDRPVLGLWFEDNREALHSSAMRLPSWFSNLLPEGLLREWIALDRGVSPLREMELLAQVGHDLPGAVSVQEVEATDAVERAVVEAPTTRHLKTAARHAERTDWRFSLAGVGMKFSMVSTGDRLTLPAHGEGGDWIVKMPDTVYEAVPRNEFAMMTLAGLCGIEVPPVRLVPRSALTELPDVTWGRGETEAFAIKRFDRGHDRRRVHIEDIAQVRGFFPEQKYLGSFETVAALVYRGRDLVALDQFVRRLAFGMCIGNGDAHLKNWSLVYPDGRRPTLAPAYDLVATFVYRSPGDDETLALKFEHSRRFSRVTLDTFARLGERLGVDGQALVASVVDTCEATLTRWDDVAPVLNSHPQLREAIADRIAVWAPRVLRKLA